MKVKLICKRVDYVTGEKFPTKKEMAVFANRLINDYCKKYNKTLETIDYDEFFCDYIGVDIQYQRLSLNKSILGMTILKSGVIETYNEDGTVKYIKTQKGEVFIDPDACGSIERELFTICHEIKHSLLDLDKTFFVNRLVDNKEIIDGSIRSNTKLGWAEYYANYFAACILLPRRKLRKLYDELHKKYVTYHHKRFSKTNISILKKIICEISKATCVSQSSISIRLKDLKIISSNTFDNLNYSYGKEGTMLFRYKKEVI